MRRGPGSTRPATSRPPGSLLGSAVWQLVQRNRLAAAGRHRGAPGLHGHRTADHPDAAVTHQPQRARGVEGVDGVEVLLAGDQPAARRVEVLDLAAPEATVAKPPLAVLVVPRRVRVVAVAAEERRP